MLGVLANPTFWVWDGTRRDLLDIRFQRPPRECLAATLGGLGLHIFEDGYVAVDSLDRPSVANSLNALFLSFSLLEGLTLEPVTERALEILEIDSNRTRSPRTFSLVQMGNIINAYEEARKEIESAGYPVVGSDELLVILELAEKLLGSSKPGSVYRMLEVSNMFSAGQWTGSFLLGWISIEEAIDAELVMHYNQEGMPLAKAESRVKWLGEKEVISKLKTRTPIPLDPPDPTPFEPALLEEFDKLRNLRNTIVHEGIPATESDAKRMRDACNRAMWRLMRHRALKYPEYLGRIGTLQAIRKSRLDPP